MRRREGPDHAVHQAGDGADDARAGVRLAGVPGVPRARAVAARGRRGHGEVVKCVGVSDSPENAALFGGARCTFGNPVARFSDFNRRVPHHPPVGARCATVIIFFANSFNRREEVFSSVHPLKRYNKCGNR